MDILIPHSWLKDFLKTTASPEKIAESLSLCGPSVEKTEKHGKDSVYSIEVTTNRVDSASVYGIAREANAILPQFKVKAILLPIKVNAAQPLVSKVDYLDVDVDYKLCPRFTAILLKNVEITESPEWMKERIKMVGLRPINNVVDITNYIMHEFGQPSHSFDYDKIKGSRVILRESKEGEEITTLDGKTHTLPGGDIVIEDGSGEIIDLAGIMGGKNSAVDQDTKNILLFVQTYNPTNIRRTSMKLSHRTEAAALFEKGLDPEIVNLTIRRGIDLFIDLCKAIPEDKILDLYPTPYTGKQVKVGVEFLQKRLGIDISKSEITNLLSRLGFEIKWEAENAQIAIPSFRANDINIPEDIIEEVARLHGYFNLPSEIMTGKIPEPLNNAPFAFEMKVKNSLKGFGGVEIYTLSLVSKDKVPYWVLKLKNPLGKDSEYLRLSLAPSLISAAESNNFIKTPFHLFEMSNVYLPVRNQLPEEKMMLGGIFSNFQYPNAKGIIEALLESLGVSARFKQEDGHHFLPNHRLNILADKEEIGQFGYVKENLIYYEFDTDTLRKATRPLSSYKPIPKYPPQIEDISLVLSPRTLVGDTIETIKKTDQQIISVELIDTYDKTKTFRISYQNPTKTLTDKEVEKIREKLLKILEKKFGAKLKLQ